MRLSYGFLLACVRVFIYNYGTAAFNMELNLHFHRTYPGIGLYIYTFQNGKESGHQNKEM